MYDKLEIDLHGLEQVEAVGIIENALLEFESHEAYTTLEIIVGRGESLSVLVENRLNSEGYMWMYKANNSGVIVVLK